MATLFDSFSLCNGIIASGKLCDYEYFLITVLSVKTKEISVKKFAFYRVQFLRFLAENILEIFINRSTTARVDQKDIKFVFCMKIGFSGLLYP